MIRHQLFAAIAAFLSIVASPLAAEPAGELVYPVQYGGDLLPPYEVNTIVRSMGMNPLHRPFWRHGRYVVRAIDRAGREMRVTVDARNGQVLDVQPVASGGYEPRRDYGARQDNGPHYDPRPDLAPRWGNAAPPSYSPQPQPQDEDDNEMGEDEDEQLGELPPSDPPRVIPAPRSAAPAPRTATVTPSVPRAAAATPSTPPLPRPKPAGQQAASNAAAPPQGPVRQIELYKKPDAGEAASKDAGAESGKPKIELPPVQPLDDTPSVKPNL